LEFRIGSVLARTWVLFSRRALTFLMLMGCVGLATVLSAVLLQQGWLVLVDMTFSFTLHGIAQAIVILATFQEMRGDGVSPSVAVSYAMGRMLPLLALTWMYTFAILTGLMLCIAPGLFFITITAVAFSACVVERLGPIKSIMRSAGLTAGHRWPILAVFGTWWAIQIGATVITFRGLPKDQVLPRELVIWLWSTQLSAYLSVLTAVVYHDLRAEKEGIGVQEIAAIFD
jgi:hypothetical protein